MPPRQVWCFQWDRPGLHLRRTHINLQAPLKNLTQAISIHLTTKGPRTSATHQLYPRRMLTIAHNALYRKYPLLRQIQQMSARHTLDKLSALLNASKCPWSLLCNSNPSIVELSSPAAVLSLLCPSLRTQASTAHPSCLQHPGSPVA